MARPIEPTEPLDPQDAAALLDSLKVHASRAEMTRRLELAKRRTAEAMKPKGVPTSKR